MFPVLNFFAQVCKKVRFEKSKTEAALAVLCGWIASSLHSCRRQLWASVGGVEETQQRSHVTLRAI